MAQCRLDGAETIVTVRLEPQETGTLLHLRHASFPNKKNSGMKPAKRGQPCWRSRTAKYRAAIPLDRAGARRVINRCRCRDGAEADDLREHDDTERGGLGILDSS
jgi:hypothetical protein